MRMTIEQLTVTKTFYKRGQDAFGNKTKEPYEKKVKREVQLVTGWMRFAHYLLDSIIIGVVLFAINLFWQQGSYIGVSIEGDKLGLAARFIPTIDQIVVTVAYYFN